MTDLFTINSELHAFDRLFGLIGYPLSHSFSKKHFKQKFEQEKIADSFYELFPLASIEQLPELLAAYPNLHGLNVTLPYKQQVLPFLDAIDPAAEAVGAVNTLKLENGTIKGYNTDVFGFAMSLQNLLDKNLRKVRGALILGTGGAAKAVAYVLEQMEIFYLQVSRSANKGDVLYSQLNSHYLQDFPLIINTTPLGTAPNIATAPDIPYQYLHAENILVDLVYNPEKTLFLKKGIQASCLTKNGLEMLYLQAEESWRIWNNQ